MIRLPHRLGIVTLVVLCALFAGGPASVLTDQAGVKVQAAAPSAQLPALVPREVLFGNPERFDPQLSPDGVYLTYRAPDASGAVQVWIRTVGQADDRPLTSERSRPILGYGWTFDGTHLVYVQDASGDENFHFFAINIHTGDVRDLTPFQGVQAQLVAGNADFPNELLVGLNLQDRRRHDVYRLNIETGELTLDTENPGNVVGWIVDQSLQVRGANAVTRDGGVDLLVRDAPGGPFRLLRHWNPEDGGSGRFFLRDGRTLIVVGNHDANASRLLAVDTATGVETVLAEDPEYDLGGFIAAPGGGPVQLVAFVRDRLQWQALDPALQADVDAITAIGGTTA